jgi:putative ABC transport system permease protein
VRDPLGDLRELWFRLVSAARRRSFERDLDDEIRFHHEMLERDLRSAGVSETDAAYRANRRFGNATDIRERSRHAWGFPSIESIGRDLSYAARALCRAPAFTGITILTLALGIGANTAIFTVVDAALLRPLPYRSPNELVTINHSYHSAQITGESDVSAPGFRDYRARTRSFAAMAAETPWDANMSGNGSADRVTASRVTSDFFAVFGVSPIMGRGLTADDTHPGAPLVAVISEGLWRERFGASPRVLGQTLRLDSQPYAVVGVMPASFRDFAFRTVRLWTPLAFTGAELDPSHYTDENLELTARLAPGISIEQARDELARQADVLRREHANQLGKSWSLSATSLTDRATARTRTGLLVMLGAVGFVLLIACANVANLFLTRAATRGREIAVRRALGATRAVIVRQLLAESMLIGAASGAAGLGLAWVATRALTGIAGRFGDVGPFAVDHRVLVFTAALGIGTGLLFGIIPAVSGSKTDVIESLKAGTRASSPGRLTRRLRGALVVGEVALALILLAGAALLVKSVMRLQAITPGFEPHGVLTFKLSVAPVKYPSGIDRLQFFGRVLQAIARVPHVTGVAATNALPFDGNNWNGNFIIEGYPIRSMGDMPWGDRRVVNADYFATLRVPLREGRYFMPSDGISGQRVAIVDDRFVARYFPGQRVVGKRVSFNRVAGDTAHEWSEIVGVVGHVAHEGLDAFPRLQSYQPFPQFAGPLFGLEVAVRVDGDPMGVVPAVRSAVRSVDTEVPIAALHTMDALIDMSIGPRRFTMLLLEAFSLLALVLASVGVYGVMAYSIASRTREMGIRFALGASTRGVLALVLRQGMTLAGVGAALGLVAASALTRLLRNQLYGLAPTDPPSFLTATAVLLVATAAACWVPAWRASRMEVTGALRNE